MCCEQQSSGLAFTSRETRMHRSHLPDIGKQKKSRKRLDHGRLAILPVSSLSPSLSAARAHPRKPKHKNSPSLHNLSSTKQTFRVLASSSESSEQHHKPPPDAFSTSDAAKRRFSYGSRPSLCIKGSFLSAFPHAVCNARS